MYNHFKHRSKIINMNFKNFIKNSSMFLILLFLICSCEEKQQDNTDKLLASNEEKVANLQITKSAVYSTTATSDVKLQLTSQNLSFSNFNQPLETEASIFINTSKLHQTFLGIGAALTDAAAETFYRADL